MSELQVPVYGNVEGISIVKIWGLGIFIDLKFTDCRGPFIA